MKKISRHNNLVLFKKKDAPTNPNTKDVYFDLVAKVPNTEEKMYPGTFWWKQTLTGLNYFSGEMKKDYTNPAGATFPGFSLVSNKELDDQEALLESLLNKVPDTVQSIEEVAQEFKNGEVKIEDIPF